MINEHGQPPVIVCPCVKQRNLSDCGVYTAAFASELALNGISETEQVIVYDVFVMRQHLCNWLDTETVAAFSHSNVNLSKRRTVKSKTVYI